MVWLEKDKAILEYLKHASTLASGGIAVLAGLFDKYANLPGGRASVSFSIICFCLSLLLNVVAYSISLFCFFGREGFRSKAYGWAFSLCAVASIAAMFAGFASIGWSAVQQGYSKPGEEQRPDQSRQPQPQVRQPTGTGRAQPTPQLRGATMSVSVPPISGEQRAEIARYVKKPGGDSQVAVRAIR
jgi:hypothetical protein